MDYYRSLFWENFNSLMNSNFNARNEIQVSHSINALTNSMKFTGIDTCHTNSMTWWTRWNSIEVLSEIQWLAELDEIPWNSITRWSSMKFSGLEIIQSPVDFSPSTWLDFFPGLDELCWLDWLVGTSTRLDSLTLARTWSLKFDSTATLYSQAWGELKNWDLTATIKSEAWRNSINQFTNSTAMEFNDTMNFNGLMEKLSNFGLKGNGIKIQCHDFKDSGDGPVSMTRRRSWN